MAEVSLDELRRHVERLNECRAELRHLVPVEEEFQSQVAWEGIVHVFDLDGHPSASTCYAWSSPIEGSENRRVFSVLHTDVIDSPAKAVQAAIVHGFREE